MPYNDQNDKELLNAVKNTEVQYDDAWNGISDECRDFLKQLLNRNIEKRLSIDQALNHAWITKNKSVRYI